jgi:hypothetical protein
MAESVIFRVNVAPEFRARLKLLSVRMGVTMGELVSRLSDSTETITELEEKYGLTQQAKGKK